MGLYSIKIAVLWRPGRNVEWQGQYLGEDIPDDAIEEATVYRDNLREIGCTAELVKWQKDDIPKMIAELSHYCLVFNASSLQEIALLEICGIPFCGSPLELVSLDKATRKKIWAYHEVPTAPFFVIDKDEREGGHIIGLNKLKDSQREPTNIPISFPVFVKPVRGRNSTGISDDSIAYNHEALARQAELIINRLGQGALVETYIKGQEVTVGLIGNPPTVLEPLEIEYNKTSTNTFEHKKDNEIVHCPARLKKEMKEKVEEVALRAYKTIGARDFGRVDIIIDPEENPIVLEINTFAGLQVLTGKEKCLHSSYIGIMAKKMGLDIGMVFEHIVNSAVCRHGLN